MITRREFLAGAAALAVAGCSKKAKSDKHIVVYNWPYYMSPWVLVEFEKKYGINVVHEIYATGADEELPVTLEKVDQIDIVVPGQDVLEELIRKKMLQQLQHDRLSNVRNLLPKYRDQYFDPGNRYSVPYLWGTTGLGVNLMKIPDLKATWQLLWRPEVAGKVSFLTSPTEVLGALLKMMGRSVNGATMDQIYAAGAELVKHKDQRPQFLDNTLGPLSSGKIWVAHSFSGDALQARKVERTVSYLLPEEGALWWIDSLCIPAKAPHPVEAHLFIDFLLDGEISAMLSNDLWYANPNAASFKHTMPEVLKDPAVYPRKELLDRCELKRNDPNSVISFVEYWKAFQGLGK